MPRFYNYRRGYRRGYGRRYRRWYNRSWSRFGSSRIANRSSRSQISLKFECNDYRIMAIAANATEPTFTLNVTPFMNIFPVSNKHLCMCNLIENDVYRRYVEMYDEVKIRGCVVKVTINSAVGSGALPSLTVNSCFDRKGCYEDIRTAEAVMSNSSIKNSSAYMSKTFLNNSVCVFRRSCFASDLMEKIMFHDCTIDPANVNRTVNGDTVASRADMTWMSSQYSTPFFCPNFWLGIERPKEVNGADVNVALSVMWYVTFRNPKYGVAAAAKGGSGSEVDVEPVERSKAGKSVSDVGELEDAFKKLRVSGVLGDDDDVLKKWKEKRLARKRKAMKVRALLKAMDEEKDDDTLIDPEEEVLPDDDDLLDMDDDDVPTQPIRELENKSSS